MNDPHVAHLTATRTVAISTAWHLFGRIFPLLLAIGATPFLLHAMGIERWGVFTLAIALGGTFSIFDIGVGRALTRTVADALAQGVDAAPADATLTGILLLGMVGVVFALVVALGMHVYVEHALHLPPALEGEVLAALDVLCLSLPVVVVNTALWGILAAYQRVGAFTVFNLPILTLYHLGPLAALAIWPSLVPVMVVQLLSRLLTTGVLWVLVRRAMPSLAGARISFAAIRPVLRLGGWMTVSNIAWPALVYLDRFVIASVLSPAAAAWYATPFDVVFRFTSVPQSVMAAAFPAMTTAHRAQPSRAALLYRYTMLAVGGMVLPAALLIIAVPGVLLRLWLGDPFALHAAEVLRLLGLGILFYSLDIVADGLLDGLGRPAFNARLALLEIVILVPLLLVLLPLFGVTGAAACWVLRIAISFLLRVAVLTRVFPEARPELRRLAPVFGGALLALTAAMTGPLAAAGGLVVVAGLAWMLALDATERATLLAKVQLLPSA